MFNEYYWKMSYFIKRLLCYFLDIIIILNISTNES